MGELKSFVLSGQHLTELVSGFGSSDAVKRLVVSENNWRKLALARLFHIPTEDTVREHIRGAVAILTQSAPTADRLIAHPSFGNWVSDALHAAYYEESDARQKILRLGGFAAAAGIKAGLDFAIETAVEPDGSVLLPLLGRVAFASADPLAVIRQEHGVVTVSDSSTTMRLPNEPRVPANSWKPAQWLRAEAEGLRLNVDLNDSYLLRDTFDAPSTDPISYEAHQEWQRLFAEAWQILAEHHPRYAEGIAAGFQTIVPLQSLHGQGRSVTSGTAFGAAAMTQPKTGEQLACGIVHEFQHSKLYALLRIIDLHKKDEIEGLFYAPWRDDPRPGVGLLQGAYAHLAIADFWRRQKDIQVEPSSQLLAAVEFARWHEAELRTVQLLSETGSLNQTGEDLLAHIQASLTAWDGEPLPDGARDIARMQTLDHEISWRMHNLVPDTNAIRSLADAFQRGETAPRAMIPTMVVAERKGKDFAFIGHRSRRSLAGIFMRDRSYFDKLLHDETARAAVLPHATEVDAFLVCGDEHSAIKALNVRLGADPANIEAWAGLALIYAQRTANKCEQPEVAAAIYRNLPPEVRVTCVPGSILDWLG